jgi:hypothetical protein
MDRKELIALKLQMGINPFMQVSPNILRAMWHQLNIESVNARRNQSSAMPHPNSLDPNHLVV